MKLLTHHLIIRCAFRKKCIFTDYIMKEFLFWIWIILFCSRLKLSIDIFIMSVRKIFAEFRCIFVKRSKTETGEIASYLFSLFYKSTTFCWYCECTQIKIDPLQFRTMYLFLPLWAKMTPYLICFHWCPEACFSFHSPHKRLDMHLKAHIYLGYQVTLWYALSILYLFYFGECNTRNNTK